MAFSRSTKKMVEKNSSSDSAAQPLGNRTGGRNLLCLGTGLKVRGNPLVGSPLQDRISSHREMNFLSLGRDSGTIDPAAGSSRGGVSLAPAPWPGIFPRNLVRDLQGIEAMTESDKEREYRQDAKSLAQLPRADQREIIALRPPSAIGSWQGNGPRPSNAPCV